MCKWGTDTIIGVIRRNNEFIPDGWHMKGVDSCIAEQVQYLNMMGVVTVGCCCGHGEHPGDIGVDIGSKDKLAALGYPIEIDPEWPDLLIIRLPLLEKTWEDEVQS